MPKVLSKHCLIRFPKESESSPRMKIAHKECPDEYDSFTNCLKENAQTPAVCAPNKDTLFECAKPAYRKANTDPEYRY